MMYVKKAQLFNMISTNSMGIVSKKRQDYKQIFVSDIQGINMAEVQKTYGIEKNVVGQVFAPAFDAETLLSLSYIEIDGVCYYITQAYNYMPSHSILLLEVFND